MRTLIRIELFKLATTRLTYGLLAAAGVLTALLTVLRAAGAGSGRTLPLDTSTGLATVLTVVGFALLLAVVFGVTISSGEFRHGTATSTYLAFPRRGSVLVAKSAAGAIAGLAFGAVGFAMTSAVGLAFVAGKGFPVALSAGAIAGDGIGAVLAAGLLAAVGVALGALVRGQLGAVIGVLIWGFFVESILGGVFNSIGPFLPFTAATTLAGAKLGGGGFGYSGTSTAGPLPFAAALALLLGVALALALTASRTTLRRDIN